MYPLLGLPVEKVFVGTHVCRMPKRLKKSRFIPFEHDKRLRARLVPRWENPLIFHPRYASHVLRIPYQRLHPGNYRPFGLTALG